MWILTIVLLLSNGDLRIVTHPFDTTFHGARCHAAAHDAWQLNDAGFHVVSVTCSKAKRA